MNSVKSYAWKTCTEELLGLAELVTMLYGCSEPGFQWAQTQKAKAAGYLRGRGLSIVIINHTVIAFRPISRMSCIGCHPALSHGPCSLTLCILTVITIQASTNHHQLQHKPTVMVTQQPPAHLKVVQFYLICLKLDSTQSCNEKSTDKLHGEKKANLILQITTESDIPESEIGT